MLQYYVIIATLMFDKKQKYFRDQTWNRRPTKCWVMAVLHPDVFWAYHFLEIKDWIV